MRRTFAGLGFDPAPGSAGDVRAAADAIAGAGDRLAGSPGSMRALLTADGWQGAAAEGFATAGAPVPDALEVAHGELRAASGALRTWHGRLVVNQHAAERLDAAARRLRQEIAEAERAVLAADTRLASATGPNRSRLAADLRTAQQNLAHLRTHLSTTLRSAHRLAQRHRRQADSAAAALRGAPPSTSWSTAATDGLATDVGGASAWTGQVATITLPGETDPVVALPIGAQPGDPNWPVLPADPTGQDTVDPAGLPDLTGAAAATANPAATIPLVEGLPTEPTGERPATDATRPAAAVLAGPVTTAAGTVLSERTPASTTTRHREPAVARLVSTPTHTARTTVLESAPSTPVHRAATPDRHVTTTRQSEPARHSDPGRHSETSQHSETARQDEPARRSEPGQQGGPRRHLSAADTTAGSKAAQLPSHLPKAAPAPPAAAADPFIAPSAGTTAETVAIPAELGTATGGQSPATAGPNLASGPAPGIAQSAQPSSPPAQHMSQATPQHDPSLAAAPGQQVAASPTDQGRVPNQAGSPNSQQGAHQGTQHGNGADHRKADQLPVAPLLPDLPPGMYTGVVLPAPPQWDGTTVAPLRAAGLLPDPGDGLLATFVIAAALGPALITESVAGAGQRKRSDGKRRGKPNRMRAFLVQPGGEQLVMLTLEGRGAEGWTTQRALFLRAVAQYRRPAEAVRAATP